jgi:hypothetical protein
MQKNQEMNRGLRAAKSIGLNFTFITHTTNITPNRQQMVVLQYIVVCHIQLHKKDDYGIKIVALVVDRSILRISDDDVDGYSLFINGTSGFISN